MKLYLLTNPKVKGYDVYQSAVVAAETPTKARRIHPSEHVKYDPTTKKFGASSGSWPADPTAVHCKLIGEAAPSIKAGIICVDFYGA